MRPEQATARRNPHRTIRTNQNRRRGNFSDRLTRRLAMLGLLAVAAGFLFCVAMVHASTLAPIPEAIGIPRSVTCANGLCVIAGQDTAQMAHLWVVSPGTVPSAPPLLGQLSTTIAAGPAAGFLGIALNPSGTVAVAAVGNQGVDVLDLSNPMAPRIGGSVALSPGHLAYAVALQPSQNVAYIAAGSGWDVINLADPTHPIATAGPALVGYELDIALQGTTLYVLNQNGSLHVLDITNSLAPVLVRDLSLPRFSYHLAVSGTKAAILSTSTTQSFLDVLDLTTPTNPSVSGSIVTGALPAGTSVSLVGTTASVVLSSGVQTYDVSSGVPVLLSAPDQALTWIDTGSAYQVGAAPVPLAIAPIPGAPTVPPVSTPTPSPIAAATFTFTAVATMTASRTSTPSPIPATPTNTAPVCNDPHCTGHA